jgi:hypothetical protein
LEKTLLFFAPRPVCLIRKNILLFGRHCPNFSIYGQDEHFFQNTTIYEALESNTPLNFLLLYSLHMEHPNKQFYSYFQLYEKNDNIDIFFTFQN